MRRRRRGLLRMYYGVDDSVQVQQDNPLDIDKAGFKADMFMEKMLKETSLNNLYKQEERMKKGMVYTLTTLHPYPQHTHTLYPYPQHTHSPHTLSTHTHTHTHYIHTLSYPPPIPSAHTHTLYPYPQHTHTHYIHTLSTHTHTIPIPSAHTHTIPIPISFHAPIPISFHAPIPSLHTHPYTHTTCSHQPLPPHTPEIQELDSNMQYLVYENHSKFIKASETIREVRH